MIGRLMYAMTATRPDIAYSFAVLSRYTHDPNNEHTVALKRTFRYLNGTKDSCLHSGGALRGALNRALAKALRAALSAALRAALRATLGAALGGALGREGQGALGCCVDSDYAGCPDDYTLTNGLGITFGGAVDWRSRKQKSTAQSKTDAECSAFGVGCMGHTRITHLLNELGIRTIPHVVSN
jgi:hypothetical protein